MGDVVRRADGQKPRVGFPNYERNAADWLVSRLFTDAIFNQDIYAIQTIINRIDGGLPRDVEVGKYQTLFGDCINDVLAMEHAEQVRITPDDTAMMALCKSLYDMATQDIYANGKPKPDVKKERDTAMRMVLERAGGRKTSIESAQQEQEVVLADWIRNVLPSAEEQHSDVV